MNRVLGIVAEYNPFHNGHKFHLEQSKKEANADYTIAVIGGNFTQRGDASLVNKWAKAEMALQAGIDLVLELPVVYATSSAENFAEGAIRLLENLKIVDSVSFGSEIGELEILDSIADVLNKEPKEFSAILQKELKNGDSFPKARENAIIKYFKNSDNYSAILSEPNNILAIEYLKALRKYKSSIDPITIKRENSDPNTNRIKNGFASSSEIRRLIYNKENVKTLIPKTTFNILKTSIKNGELITGIEDFEQAIIYNLRTMTLEQIANIPDVSEGLENKIKKAVNENSYLENIIDEIKSKRYTETRVRRILLHSLLGISKKDVEVSKRTIPYARVLGFNAQGKKMISAISKKNPKLNIIISVKNFVDKSSNKNHLNMLSTDVLATNVYTLAYRENSPANLDFTEKVIKY